jgi:hypothetical protein
VSRQKPDIYGRDALAGLPLFNTPLKHMSAAGDPPTSRAAAAAMKDSGQLARDQAVALAMVRAIPGATCPELAAKAAREDVEKRTADFWRNKIGRRLNELAQANLIEARHASGPYACWWPINEKTPGRSGATLKGDVT